MAAKRRSAAQKRHRERAAVKSIAFSAVILVILLAAGFVFLNDSALHIEGIPTTTQILHDIGGGTEPVPELTDDSVAVHYIDVGQGDCELIVTQNCNVLIDCGEDAYADAVLRYLNYQGIDKLDYVIVTHPHSDHMGGMYRILSEITVGKLLMPELSDDLVPLTAAFTRLLDAVEEKNINASYAKPGERITLDTDTYLEILAPLYNDYSDLNNFSVVARLVHGSNSFLFTGDIEKEAEVDILNSGSDISSTVLKVAHHGSSSSGTPLFLAEAAPEYAVICVGRDNSYGHPTQTVLDRLSELGCEILTTAECGNIVFVSDGTNLSLSVENGDESEAA